MELANVDENSLPYLSRIGARVSKQSRPLTGYAELERAVATEMIRHPRGRVPRPANRTGYILVHETIELWAEKPFRMYQQITYTATATSGPRRRCIRDRRLRP